MSEDSQVSKNGMAAIFELGTLPLNLFFVTPERDSWIVWIISILEIEFIFMVFLGSLLNAWFFIFSSFLKSKFCQFLENFFESFIVRIESILKSNFITCI